MEWSLINSGSDCLSSGNGCIDGVCDGAGLCEFFFINDWKLCDDESSLMVGDFCY